MQKASLILFAKLEAIAKRSDKDFDGGSLVSDELDLQNTLQHTARERTEGQLTQAIAALKPLAVGKRAGGGRKTKEADPEAPRWKDNMKAAVELRDGIAGELNQAFKAAEKEHSYTAKITK